MLSAPTSFLATHLYLPMSSQPTPANTVPTDRVQLTVDPRSPRLKFPLSSLVKFTSGTPRPNVVQWKDTLLLSDPVTVMSVLRVASVVVVVVVVVDVVVVEAVGEMLEEVVLAMVARVKLLTSGESARHNQDKCHILEPGLAFSCSYRLTGLVVKASPSGAEDPGFESRLRRDFSRSSHTSDLRN